jgi:hypothetical protein
MLGRPLGRRLGTILALQERVSSRTALVASIAGPLLLPACAAPRTPPYNASSVDIESPTLGKARVLPDRCVWRNEVGAIDLDSSSDPRVSVRLVANAFVEIFLEPTQFTAEDAALKLKNLERECGAIHGHVDYGGRSFACTLKDGDRAHGLLGVGRIVITNRAGPQGPAEVVLSRDECRALQGYVHRAGSDLDVGARFDCAAPDGGRVQGVVALGTCR